MKRLLFLTLVLCSCSVMPTLQKRKLITVFHLIETARYDDAKKMVEEMIADPESSQWGRTWYARGLLCQTAYQSGAPKGDKKLTELYPDQLYVAWDSYEKALTLDRVWRFEKILTAKYINLANEFQKMGEAHFQKSRYQEALRAFGQAIRITESPLVTLNTSQGLLYNAGLAAFEAGDRVAASLYLIPLHTQKYSPGATHLLFSLHLNHGDSAAASSVIQQGVEWFSLPTELVLPLADLWYHQGMTDSAMTLLNRAIAQDTTGNGVLQMAKGVVLQKSGRYADAISAYHNALLHEPGRTDVLLNMATCWYNLGVESDEVARTMHTITQVEAKKNEAAKAYASALEWLRKAQASNSNDRVLLTRMQQLSILLRIPVVE